ncbi:MAG: pseudouridine synthase [Segatella copri]|uniref:RluA family pseudouridine synthase n=1 Tax=Prevotella sp. LCP21S3_D2 TaxID=3438800 RepID=UPI003B499749
MIFHSIDQALLSGIDFPERMNNPLDYQPHPLCIAVCKELQTYLSEREDWREEIDKGKMFGVLIVENAQPASGAPKIGYLAAYSGQIGGRSDWDDFVPAVFDYLQPDGYFKTHEAEISGINQSIRKLEANTHMKEAKGLILQLQEERKHTIAAYQEKIKKAKAKRDARREAGSLNPEEEAEMVKESQFMKAELRRLKKSLSEKTSLETEYEAYQADILSLKQLRKTLSDALQQWLFSQFRMQNHEGESKDLLEIFRDAALRDYPQATIATSRIAALKMVPPAGSGECCEPKLLQYAYSLGYKPLQMAMFWWGESPKEEIRHHLHFYPACNGKCKPILQWMLPASTFEPAAVDLSLYNKVETLYEDREIAVIHKPEGLLSVPGKDAAQPSVYALMRSKYPEATGPLIVHRLDMSTSGVMMIAKTEFAYHRLQKAFLNHQIQKKYVAIISGKVIPEKGIISLPLMPDYLDRPRQIVDHELGKEAITEYEVLEPVDDSHLRIALYPKTGRTHQLRVHCAHQEGLNAPILGDPLYGNEKAARLHLHAEEITFEHPLTGKKMTITRKADF